MAHNLVDRDAGGESDTPFEILGFLGRKGLLDFLFNHGVNCLANGVDVCAGDCQLAGLLQTRVCDFSRGLEFVEDGRLVNEGLLSFIVALVVLVVGFDHFSSRIFFAIGSQ